MRYASKILVPMLLPLGLALSGCENGSTAAPDAQPAGEGSAHVTLGVGESVRVNGVRLSFLGVSRDSRCASDVTCVWSGNGVVDLEVGPPGLPGTTLALNTHLDPRSETSSGLLIELVELRPYPASTDPIDPADYVVELEVVGAGS